jgi:endonuclease/exonuclease/phosphatase (EEP) superfamily protein YafD
VTKNIDDAAQLVFNEQASVLDINEPVKNDRGYTDYVAELVTKLNAKFPGRTWAGQWLGVNAILWLTPGSSGLVGMSASTIHPVYTYTNHDGYVRTIGAITFTIDNKTLSIATTHLACDGASGCPGDNTSIRTAQANELLTWDNGVSDPLVVGGDFNDTPGTAPINTMTGANGYNDADAGGMTTTDGGHRYDYIFYRKTATQLSLFDHYVTTPIASNGHWPSDHRPVVAVFDVLR